MSTMTDFSAQNPSTTAGLRRNLGLWAVVGLGLGYMTPTVIFDTFGLVSHKTNNVVPSAYLVALIVMLFTAISYSRMARTFPSAGSAYTYAREAIHPNVGFMVGWTSLIDYVMLPLVNCLIIRNYLVALFPAVPEWIWVVVYCVVVTAIIALTMRGTANVNMFLLVAAIAVMAVFVVLVVIQLDAGDGMHTLVSTNPFFHHGVDMSSVLVGATIVCFSFIGFDAVTMYSEEAKNTNVVPRAIVWTVLIGGALFLVAAYFTQLRFPTVDDFPEEALNNSSLPHLGIEVGGRTLQAVLTAAGFCATLASGLASHASVSRMLLVMGRNSVLPRKIFGYVSPKTRTPLFNVILVGAISLLSIAFNLDTITSYINFGALIAFTFVNLSVLAWFAVRKKRVHTFRDIIVFVVLPVIGTAMTGLLWIHLQADALIVGLIWAGIGLLYLIYLSRGFRRPISSFDESQPVTGFTKVPSER